MRTAAVMAVMIMIMFMAHDDDILEASVQAKQKPQLPAGEGLSWV